MLLSLMFVPYPFCYTIKTDSHRCTWPWPLGIWWKWPSSYQVIRVQWVTREKLGGSSSRQRIFYIGQGCPVKSGEWIDIVYEVSSTDLMESGHPQPNCYFQSFRWKGSSNKEVSNTYRTSWLYLQTSSFLRHCFSIQFWVQTLAVPSDYEII